MCMIDSARGPSGGNTSAVAPLARDVDTPPAVTVWNCLLIELGSLSASTYWAWAQHARVNASITIGAVGMTGWATGPHLHFEFKLDGEQQDPLLVAQNSEGVVLTPQAKARLTELSASVRGQLAVAQTLAHAQVLGE